MAIDESILSWCVRWNDLSTAQRAGVTKDHFLGVNQQVWSWLEKAKRDHETLPSKATLISRFPDFEWHGSRQSEWPLLIVDLRERKRYIDFLHAIGDATNVSSQADTDAAIASLQSKLNGLTFSGHGRESPLVDLFSAEASREIRMQHNERAAGQIIGIPTGLARIDSLHGGLQPQRLVTLMARTGVGKSWMDLLFVASAIVAGKKVILYPLEMTLYETATRLYSLLANRILGPGHAMVNTQLNSGSVSRRELSAFMKTLQREYAGQLYVADTSSLYGSYTMPKIEAEVEQIKPDMFWIDYITLVDSPDSDLQGWEQVSKLTKAAKQIAVRQNVVGGISAQVNRQGASSTTSLPRVENIAYGDAIGQDSDTIVSLARDDRYLYYGVTKQRGGPEIGKTRCKYHFDTGLIEETPDQPEDED